MKATIHQTVKSGRIEWKSMNEAPADHTWILMSHNGGPAWVGEWDGKMYHGIYPCPTSWAPIPIGAF